jgi:hypothetical protein
MKVKANYDQSMFSQKSMHTKCYCYYSNWRIY